LPFSFDKSDSVNKEILRDLSQIIKNSNIIQNNSQKNNEILLQENLELKNKINTFAQQNKVMKKILIGVGTYFLTKYLVIPELKTIIK